MSCNTDGDCCDGGSSNRHAHSSKAMFTGITYEKVVGHVVGLPATTSVQRTTKEIMSIATQTEFAQCWLMLVAGFCSSFCLKSGLGAVLIGLVIAVGEEKIDLALLQKLHGMLMVGVNEVRR